MALRLFHAPNSRSARVHWLLEELGAEYELVPVTRDDRATDAHRARHPLGRVPALETKDGVVFETAAICLYLGELHPESGVLPPEGSFDRALVYQWISFGLTEIEPFLAEARRAEESDPERAELAHERVRVAVAAVDSALSGHDYLVGDSLTVADVLCGSTLLSARRTGLTDTAPTVNAYLDRLEARPARLRAYPPAD
jgi:glutathione S-transferase